MKTSLVCLSATAIAITAGVSFASSVAGAEPVYPWCAVSSSGGLGQPLCHFATLEQCNAFLMGLNGSCRPNPRATAVGPAAGKGHRS
jgi:Protein of unknown function (DUF3551)